MYLRRCIALWLLLAAGLSLPAQTTYAYVVRGQDTLQLDFYVPQHPRADHVCVLYAFGGGFMEGARNDTASRMACHKLQQQGFYVASIDYRLGLRMVDFDTVHLLKAYQIFARSIDIAVEDCSAAVAYLCEHAATLGIDPAHIVLTGSSAGAITVLQTDYCRANGMAPAAALPKDFVPMAVIPYAGAVYTDHARVHYDAAPAPTCFFHGTTDRIVSYRHFRSSTHSRLNGANDVAKHYARNDYNYWIFRFTDRGHEVAAYLPFTVQEFTAFVDAVAAGRVMQYDAQCKDRDRKQTQWSKMTLFDLYLK